MGSGWGDQFPPLAMVNPTEAWARKDLVWGWAPSPREDDESPWSCQDWIQRAAPPTHPGSLLCPQLIFLLPDSMMGSGPIQRADPPALKTGQTSPGVQKGLSQGCLQHPPPPPPPIPSPPPPQPPRLLLGAGQGRDSGWPIILPREVTLPGARAIRKLWEMIAQIAAGSLRGEGEVGLGLPRSIPPAS